MFSARSLPMNIAHKRGSTVGINLAEYAWALLILIGLEGLLSADNALVLAVIAKHLPEDQKKKAINYGIIMAFVFASRLYLRYRLLRTSGKYRRLEPYLLYLGLKHIIKARFGKENKNIREDIKKDVAGKGFWPTVSKIAIADLAFAIDSILPQWLWHWVSRIHRFRISVAWTEENSWLLCLAESPGSF